MATIINATPEPANWLEDSIESYFPYSVTLQEHARGWAKYLVLHADKKWRVRKKGVLCFESKFDAEDVFNRYGEAMDIFDYEKIQDKLDEFKAAIKDPENPGRKKNRDYYVNKKPDSWNVWQRHSIAFQMFVAGYSMEEIADELQYSDLHSVGNAINYYRRQQISLTTNLAKMYQEEVLAHFNILYIALENKARKDEYNHKTVANMIAVLKEMANLSGANAPEKLEIINSYDIDAMGTDELSNLLKKAIDQDQLLIEQQKEIILTETVPMEEDKWDKLIETGKENG